MSASIRIFLSAMVIIPALTVLDLRSAVAETYRVYGVVSGDVLFIRAQPSSKAKRIGSIPPYGKGVERLGPCRGSWCKIRYRGMTGWTSMKYLTPEALPGSSYRVRGIRNDDVLFIRAWPSAKSEKVGTIPPDGRGVSKLGPCKANWCKIRYRGITGWASMMYLVADGSIKPAAPAYTPPPQHAAPAPAPRKPTGNQLSARMTSLLASSRNFQETAITNFFLARHAYASDRGSRKLDEINTTIWTKNTFQYGWMVFFNSAVRVLGKSPEEFPVVGYYNPYSDTMLVTVWMHNGSSHTLVDAEMLMGDLLRRSGKPPSNKPILLRLMNSGKDRHAAVGFGVARSMLAFEETLSNATLGNWRRKLGIFNSVADLPHLNNTGVSILVNGHLENISLYIVPDENDRRLIRSRKIVSETIGLLIRGWVEQALDSPRTTPPATVRKVLKTLSPEWYETMGVSFAFGSLDDFIVYLTPFKDTNLCLSLVIKNKNRRSYLDRVDVIDFRSFYNAVKNYQQKSKGG